MNKLKKGFTLVELLIVLSIISIFFAIIIPQCHMYYEKLSESKQEYYPYKNHIMEDKSYPYK